MPARMAQTGKRNMGRKEFIGLRLRALSYSELRPLPLGGLGSGLKVQRHLWLRPLPQPFSQREKGESIPLFPSLRSIGKVSSQLPTCQTLIALKGCTSINTSKSRLSLIQISNTASVAINASSDRRHPSLRAIMNPMPQHIMSPSEFITVSPW